MVEFLGGWLGFRGERRVGFRCVGDGWLVFVFFSVVGCWFLLEVLEERLKWAFGVFWLF